MALVNNTTINTRLTIIFDASENALNSDDGPRLGVGNTEADIFIDENENQINYFNIKAHTEIPSEIHCFQWNPINSTGNYEYIDNRENLNITEIPSWATNVVIRCEAEDKWLEAYNANIDSQRQAWLDADSENNEDNFVMDVFLANDAGDTARINYCSSNGITY
tara:strand:- start:7410 stop:7901 length:492 start_codon:yes stop_codon:yes gene_type:complete